MHLPPPHVGPRCGIPWRSDSNSQVKLVPLVSLFAPTLNASCSVAKRHRRTRTMNFHSPCVHNTHNAPSQSCRQALVGTPVVLQKYPAFNLLNDVQVARSLPFWNKRTAICDFQMLSVMDHTKPSACSVSLGMRCLFPRRRTTPAHQTFRDPRPTHASVGVGRLDSASRDCLSTFRLGQSINPFHRVSAQCSQSPALL